MRGDINLSLDDRATRLRTALMALAITIALVILLAELAAFAPLWLIVAPPLFVTSTLIVQAYTGVCPHHASKGTRGTGHSTEPILDPTKRTCLINKGRMVLMTSLVIALVSTSLVVLLGSIR